MIDDEELEDLARLEANLSTEVGKIVLDMLAEFTRYYKVSFLQHDWLLIELSYFDACRNKCRATMATIHL